MPIRVVVRKETKEAGPDVTMLPPFMPPGAILFVVRDGLPVRCANDLSDARPGERVYHARQLSGG